MGSYGCAGVQGHGGIKKQAKGASNARAGHVFVMCDHGKKNQEVGRDSLGGQVGSWGGLEGK